MINVINDVCLICLPTRYQAVNPVNFMEGVTADPGGLQLYLTFSTIDDFHNYTQRLNLLPKQVRRLRCHMMIEEWVRADDEESHR